MHPSSPEGDAARPGGRAPLRVLVAGLGWPAETFLARLIRGLAGAGIEVTVATERRPREVWFQGPHLRWLRAPEWRGPAPLLLARLAWLTVAAFLRSPSSFARLCRAVGRSPRWSSSRLQMWNRMLPYVGGSWDVLYFPWNLSAVLHLPLLEMGFPAVVSCRGVQVNVAPHNPNRSAAGALRASFEKAAALHCVSEAIREEAATLGLDPAKSWVIHPSVDPSFFRPAAGGPRSAGTLRIVTTGSLVWVKGYEYALSALRRLISGGMAAELSIIGDGPDRARILYTVRDLGLDGHVRLLGRLPPDRVREELCRGDVFLLSSLSEGLANAVLEAMACGLPVVTTDCGGMREAVADGVEGFVVPVRDAQAMADALSRLASDRVLRARMGTAARARVERDFTLDEQVRRFVALYEDVVARCAA